MGNQTSSEQVIILDDLYRPKDFENNQSSIVRSIKYYHDFGDFIEKENIKHIRHIIVRFKEVDYQSKMSEIDYYNPFIKICPLLISTDKSMKDKLIAYVKKLSLTPNIFLFVDDPTSVKIPEHDRPYIKKVISSMNAFSESIEQIQKSITSKIKLQRMAKDMLRKIMVKIIDPGFINDQTKKDTMSLDIKEDIQLLTKEGVSFQFYQNIQKFEKSCISTSTQYVIIQSKLLAELVDSKKINDQEYQIILRAPKHIELNSWNQKQIWTIDDSLIAIIKKMKRCSVIDEEEKPIKSKNTIVCGDDPIYNEHFQSIKNKIEKSFCESDQKAYKKLNFHYLRPNTNFSNMLKILKQDAYSYVIVFSSGQYLEELKRKLRTEKFDNRVQLTNIPKNDKMKTAEQLIDYKVKYLVGEIKYKIKFQIAPLRNIHCFRPGEQTVKFLQEQVGLQIEQINNQQEIIKDYIGPVYQKFIQSRLLVCRVEDFSERLLPLIRQYRDKDPYFSKLKYLIFDTQQSVRQFIANQKNYTPELVFVHYNLKEIKNYLEFWKTPVVSIPFYAKSVLSKFYQSAKQLKVTKNVSTIKINTSVISTNKVLNQIFKNQIKISTQHQLEFSFFSAMERGVDKKQLFYEEVFLTNFSKLWNAGYDFFKKINNRYVNLELVKDDITFGLNRCRIYNLLNVNNQDFKSLYINKIKDSQSFIDLQIACIYILSLPHGFSQILAQIFKNPRTCQLLTKMFCHYFLILVTAFSSFNQNSMEKFELINYIQEKQLEKKLGLLKAGDTLYNASFVFCRQNSEQSQKMNKNQLIFEFENIEFLQKNRTRNNLFIEPFSFYKEGTKFIIPPQTKFIVKSKKFNDKGFFEIHLCEAQNLQGKCFIEKVIQANNLTQQILQQAFIMQLKDYKVAEDMKQKVKKYSKEPSLYKRAELMNLLNSKKQLIISYEKGISSLDFFSFLKNKQYYSALETLHLRIKQYQREQEATGITNLQTKRNEKMSDIEKSLILFKMSQYSLSIKLLQNLKYILEKEDSMTQETWLMSTINKFILSVNDTYLNRAKLFVRTPKSKKWKVKANNKGSKIEFKLKSKSQNWTVSYVEQIQTFGLISAQQQSQIRLSAEPQNQFGSLVLAWINLNLYKVRKIKNNQENEKYQSNLLSSKKPVYIKKPALEKKNTEEDSSNNFIFGDLFEETVEKKQSINQKGLRKKPSQVNNYKKKDSALQNKQQIDNNSYFSQLNNLEILGQNGQQDSNMYQLENSEGYTEQMQWQIFHLGSDVKLVQKMKHFHARISKDGNAFDREARNVKASNFLID